MKHLRLLLIAVIVLTALGFQSGQATAMKFSYTSGIEIQNLSDSVASVTLDYYDQMGSNGTGGAQAKSVPVDMQPLSSMTFIPIHADPGFKGSVVVSSSNPLASIVNLHANQAGTRVGNASYVGASTGALSINLPLLHKGNYGFDSWFAIQNTGSGNASVSVAYSDNTSAGPISIKPGASYVFDQQNETHNAKVFAATVTSDQPVIAVVVQERLASNPTTKLVLAYTGFDAGDNDALMPLINANNYGFTTGVQLQNVGASDSEITVTYIPTKGSNGTLIGHQCTEKHVVAKKSSVTFALDAFAGKLGADVTTCVKEQFVGSAHITGNSNAQPVVAIVNQQTSRAAGAYGSFLPSRATAKVVFPLIMDRNYGWSTAFNLMNVGDITVDVKCVYTGLTEAQYSQSVTLAAGEALNVGQNNKVKDKYVGSGTCTATPAAGQSGAAKIAGVVNETSPDNYDNILTYEGVNIKP